MRKAILYLVVFVLLLAGPTAVRYLTFYQLGDTERQAPPEYTAANLEPVNIPTSSDFVDEPEAGNGLVLLDQSHDNYFTLDEIDYLDGRLAARGYALRDYESGDLAGALRGVKAFVVITPQKPFLADEIVAVRDFVARGGHLLLIGDPTRFSVFVEEDLLNFTVNIETDKIPLNSLANEFDIIFKDDYLYNTAENEGNFRNIILKEAGLGENDFTADLEELVFYGSHSLQVGPGGESVLMGDENTTSSDTDRPGGLTLAAASEDGRVLALGDIHFLTAPYYTVQDNAQFIARIADFLTQTERTYRLSDFPYFYGENINLVYLGAPNLGPDAFDEIIELQETFREAGHTLSLQAEADAETDTLYLGLYNQAADVLDVLASNGISLTIQPPIMVEEIDVAEERADEEDIGKISDSADDDEAETEPEPEVAEIELIRQIHSDLGNVQMSGTAVILLQESNEQHNVIVLAASQTGLENTVARLLDLIPADADYSLSDCLLQGNIALCPSDVANEVVEAEMETGGAPDVMADDEEEEASTDEDEEEPTDDEEDSGDENETEIEGVDQGSVELDEAVEGTLDSDEAHLWTLSAGPATVNIVVDADEDLDGVLELYAPDGELLETADSSFVGETEELNNVDLSTGDYTIRIRDYFADGGSYTLLVTLADEESPDDDEVPDDSSDNGRIFIFGDDDGTPLSSGFTSAELLSELLADDYDVTTWQTSEDGPLQEDTLDGYSLIIWDSGDYRNEDGFFDEDTVLVFEYLDAGGNVILMGTSPTIFGSLDLTSMDDIEVADVDSELLDGLSAGDILELDQAYDAVLLEDFGSDLEDEDIVFLLRGPDSEESGSVVGLASMETGEDTQAIILVLPFAALPADIQETLLTNMVSWMGLSATP